MILKKNFFQQISSGNKSVSRAYQCLPTYLRLVMHGRGSWHETRRFSQRQRLPICLRTLLDMEIVTRLRSPTWGRGGEGHIVERVTLSLWLIL